MFQINNDKITVTRGDTGIISLNLTQDDEPYEFSEGDKIVFSVKKKLKDTEYVLRKETTRDTIFLEHKDTDNIAPGNYYYDIEITYNTIQVATIGPNKFIVKADVTREMND